MNLLLAYDTETTGLPDWPQPSDAPQQPHLVQLSAALVDADTRQQIAGINLIVEPAGWTIPDEVADVHGITTEYAAEVGVPEEAAVLALLALWSTAPVRLGHNESFDARIIRIALKRHLTDEAADHWKAAPAICTAKLSTPICKLPPTQKMMDAGRNHPKTPKLEEAYQFFTGKELEGAHSAAVDVQACLEVYWAIQDNRNAAA